MENDNKYYNLIEKLVKNHRKYQGYEAILEEIVSDVYEHSKAVIGSIDNEEVIQSYLQKVVSTSIITVPKRLNFHNELKHRNIVSAPQISQNITQIKPEVVSENIEIDDNKIDVSEPVSDVSGAELISDNVVEEESVELYQEPQVKANPEFVDKMINSIDVDSVLDVHEASEGNDGLLAQDDLTAENDEDFEDILFLDTEDDNSVIEESDIDENDFINENVMQADLDEETFTDNVEDEDLTEHNFDELTDNEEQNELIVNDETDIGQLDLQQDTDIIEREVDHTDYGMENDDVSELDLVEVNTEYNEDFTEAENDIQTFETDDGDIESDEYLTENSEELSLNSDKETDYNEDTEVTEDIENIEDTSEISEIDNDVSLDSSNDEITGGLDEHLDLEDDIYDSTIGLEETGDSVDLDVRESEDLIEHTGLLDDNSNINFEYSESEDIEETPEINEIKHTSYKPVSYSAFNYTPFNSSSDKNSDELAKMLADLNNSKPELKILPIFELKYKKGFSIDQIAQELGIEKHDVVLALDEIIDLI